MTTDYEELMRRLRAKREAMPEQFHCDRHGSYPSGRESDATLQLTCPACRADADAATALWIESCRTWSRWQAADVPARYQTKTLENCRPRGSAYSKSLQAVRRWFAQFVDGGDMGALVLTGPPGLGKTHIGVGLIVEMVRSGGLGLYVATRDLLPALRSSYDRDAQARPGEILAPLHRADLLVLDDIGAGARGTPWEAEVFGDLVDRRYRDGGGIVITTNATMQELPEYIGERAVDRLREFGIALVLAGESYRPQATADTALRSTPPPFERPKEKLTVTMTVEGRPETHEVFSDGRRAHNPRI